MTRHCYHPGTIIDELAVFPLPQVVLFPGALMPLHIFEPRYRVMTRDILAGSGQICVALIPEDHGNNRYGQPEIASIAGVGELVRHEQLPDGRYDILVRGFARARLEELPPDRAYRRARATILATKRGETNDTEARALASQACAFANRVRLCHPGFDFALPEDQAPGQLADLCAHYLVLDGARRQSLLETLDDAERVRGCLEALMSQQAELSTDESLH